MDSIRGNAVGEMRFDGELVPPRSATEYFKQSCYVGVSQPTPADIKAALGPVGIDRVMWGSDYPHEEGTGPFTKEHLRQVMGQLPPEQIQQILAENAAKLYNFDLDALRPAADQFGPTVAEVAQPLTEAARGCQPGAAALGSAAEGRQLGFRCIGPGAGESLPLPGRCMSRGARVALLRGRRCHRRGVLGHPDLVAPAEQGCGRSCGQPVENPLITGENVRSPVGNEARRNN